MKARVILLVTAILLLTGNATAAQEARFYPVDVVIDTGGRPLSAYQFEFLYDADAVNIVGIEGGETPFNEAPYYDPQGLKTDRIVIAAFTTDKNPPRGRVLVARIHLMAVGEPQAEPEAQLILAAGPGGVKFDALIELSIIKGGENE